MVLTTSATLELGSSAPVFELPDPASGNSVDLEKYTGRPLLVAFICNHCPYVIHLQSAFATLGNDLVGRGLGVVAISANDVENYPQDGPDKMAETARQLPGRHRQQSSPSSKWSVPVRSRNGAS